jgi:hypothetical protein
MNIGLINTDYSDDAQREKLKPYADSLVFLDKSDIDTLPEYISTGDTVYITSYSFFHDDPVKGLKLKCKLDDRDIKLFSILDNTIGVDKPYCDLAFSVAIGAYSMYEFIKEYRIA